MCYEGLAKELLKSVLLRSESQVKMAIAGVLVFFHHLQIDCPLPVFIHKECSILCADCLEESDFRRYIIVFMESWPPTCFPKHINWGGRGARYNLPEDAYLINLSVFLSFAAHSFTFCWFFTICVLLVDFLVHDEPGFRVAQMTLKPKEL